MFLKIDWSSINWDIASTISSSISAAVAIIISVIALVKTSRDNNKILEENSRAYISIYTETLIANKSHFYIIVKNFGNSNAILQNIKIDDKTRDMIKLGNKDYFSSMVKTQLAPGQSITHVVSTQKEGYDREHISKFEITYTSGRKEYSDTFEFNLSMNTTTPSISIPDSISADNFHKHFLELYQDEIRKKL